MLQSSTPTCLHSQDSVVKHDGLAASDVPLYFIRNERAILLKARIPPRVYISNARWRTRVMPPVAHNVTELRSEIDRMHDTRMSRGAAAAMKRSQLERHTESSH